MSSVSDVVLTKKTKKTTIVWCDPHSANVRMKRFNFFRNIEDKEE